MGYAPDPGDRATILEMAQSAISQREISQRTGWSRPTIAKVLRQEGFDPRSPLARGVAQPAPEQTIDIDAIYAEADRQAQKAWEDWLQGRNLPTYGRPKGLPPS